MSPESIVSTGLSDASKKLRCTVVGDAFSSWIFSSACAGKTAHRTSATIEIVTVCDLTLRSSSPVTCIALYGSYFFARPSFDTASETDMPPACAGDGRNNGHCLDQTNALRPILVQLDVGAPRIVDERK